MTTTEQNDAPEIQELEQEYELLRELGRGGMGIVHLARHRLSGDLVAMKVVRASHTNSEALDRLAREARTVAALEHPNIVRHLEFRRLSAGGFAVVMQYVPGETLATVLRRTPRLPIADAERVLRDVGRALEVAHASGVVHRDIKPQNILIDAESGSVLLSDFGIAKSTEGDADLTMEGTAIGTPTYMSPEQIDGQGLDGRSDLYSLGLVGWEMLAGSRPWAGENLYGVIFKQKYESLPAVELLRLDVPPRVALALDAVLYKDPTLRLSSATDFLAQLAQDEPTAATRARRTLTRSMRETAPVAADRAAETLQFRVPSLSPAPAPAPTSPRQPAPVHPSGEQRAGVPVEPSWAPPAHRWRPIWIGAGALTALLGAAALGAIAATSAVGPAGEHRARAAGFRVRPPRPADTTSARRVPAAAVQASPPRTPIVLPRIASSSPPSPPAPPAPRGGAVPPTGATPVGAARFLMVQDSTTRARGAGPLTPRATPSLIDVAALRLSEGRYHLALASLDSAIVRDPRSARAYTLRALAQLRLGDIREAWADAEVADRLGDRWSAEAVTAMVEAKVRDTVAARARVQGLATALAARPTLDEYDGGHLAMAMAAVGDTEGASATLRRIRPVTMSLWLTLQDPAFDALRRSPRYQSLMQSLARAGSARAGR